MKTFVCHQSERARIERLSLPEGEKVNLKPHEDQLWLVMEGDIELSFLSKEVHRICSRQLLLLPAGSSCVLSVYQSTGLFRFRIPGLGKMLQEVFPGGLLYEKEYTSGFAPLLMPSLLLEYARHLSVLLESCFLSPSFGYQQSYYLLLLMKEVYGRRAMGALFSPLFPPPDPFVDLVLHHYRHVKNVIELAERCHVSLRNFHRLFREKFGLSPGQWLLERRIELVYHEVVSSSEPLTLVADKCGFTTSSRLSDFCRKYIGLPPSKLRREGKR